LTLALASVSAQPAQTSTLRQTGELPRAMSLVDIAELPRVVDPQLSPDGKLVAYMLSQPDWSAGRAIYHLWRQDTQGGAPVQLTTGAGDTFGSTRWSPDGNSILFGRDGQLMLLPLGSGTRERAVSKHATNVSSPTWSPDGASIFLAADALTSDDRERERRKDDVFALDENVRPRQL
jgi:Tol biopolymer transport system component